MHGCNGCDPYGAVNEDCPIHGNPAHEETRSRLAEVTAERDQLREGVKGVAEACAMRTTAAGDYARGLNDGGELAAAALRALLAPTPEQETPTDG